jgi:N-acetylglucosamine kinase-like BadF-type ATPase
VRTVLAVDGGNSKTDVALVAEDGELLAYTRGSQASPDHLGVEGSLEVLAALVAQLGATADLAVLLLAGVDFADEEDVYRAAAEPRRFATRLIVGNDTFAVLRAGTDEGWGVAVTCGAGINCVGVAQDGRRLRFASLGDWSGDWGGGRDVGLAAVAAAARSEDGRGASTTLEQLVPAHFGLETPTDLARALLAGRVSDRELGALAPLVLEQAERDAAAGAIVDRLADEVATMATTALRRLGLGGADVPVVLGGGILQSGNARLLGAIEERLAAVGASPRLLSSPPIVGSALLGLDELGASTDAHRRVRDELGASVHA